MPVAADTPLAGGLHRVRFATTPRMSTYLLFVTVGDYERVSRQVDGVDVGVVVKRGDLPRAAYGLEQAAALLHYYDDWFGIRYPLPKMDLIAAPGDIAGGAMENWGALFYSQNSLLFDPGTSPAQARSWVFGSISHEMAHQWFGDLVTMSWWNDLWLNEGFARWMQTHAADALHPEWHEGLRAQWTYQRGMRFDAGPGTHPVLQPIASAEQAAQAFDGITYDKGAAVIAMLEGYIGADRFRDGVRRYMRRHAFGNTVDDDLWSEMLATADKPVIAIERDFVRQAGLPLIRVGTATTPAAGTTLTQDRFRDDAAAPPLPRETWRIPLAVRGDGGATETLLLDGSGMTHVRDPLVNAGARAYARVLYPAARVPGLAHRMPRLAEVDRLNLINDAAALGRAGYVSGSDVLAYVGKLPPDSDPIVWYRAIEVLVDIDRAHAPGAGRDRFRRWALAVLAPVVARVGYTERAGEGVVLPEVRAKLLLTLATFGDDRVVEWAKGVRALGTGTAADRQAALGIVALRADPATFDALLAQARAERDPLDRGRILSALASVGDPALSARFVAVALGPEAPAGAAGGLLAASSASNPDATWAALYPRLGEPDFPMAAQERLFYVPAIASRSARPETATELRAWADRHLPADTRQDELLAESTIGQNARFRRQAVPAVDAWIESHRPGQAE